MQMMWSRLALYSFHYNIQVMFACASLRGTDPTKHAQAMSYLYHHHLAPTEIRVRALASRYVKMDVLEPGSYEPRKAMARVPPLIKGYLRLGGFVGDRAVIDPEFNTTDVFITVQTEIITEKYIRHYERGMNEQDN